MTPAHGSGALLLSRSSGPLRESGRGMSRNLRQSGRAARGPRIGLFCGYGIGNVGNDASLETAEKVIASETPGAQMVVITPFVDGAKARTSLPVVAMNPSMQGALALDAHRLVKVGYFLIRESVETLRRIRLLASLDGVIAPGTGLLDDFAESPAGMPYAVLAWAFAARLTRRPFAMVGIGAGPLVNPASRLQMRFAARLATEVTYRDEASRAYMESVDPRTGEHAVVCDLVFADVLPGTGSAGRQDLSRRPLTVGLGIMAYEGWAGDNNGSALVRYTTEMTRVVRGIIIADGDEVRILVGQPIDDLAVEAVLAGLDDLEREHVVFAPAREFTDLFREVARTDIVVATRYHNLVAALMMRRPVVSVSYAVKNPALLERVGMPGHDCPIEDVDADWVLTQVRELIASGANFPPSVVAVLDSWRGLARDAIRLAARRIEANAAARK